MSEAANRGLADWFSRRRPEAEPTSVAPPPPADGPVEPIIQSQTLRTFLSTLEEQPTRSLVDLGAAVPSNVTLFADTLGCKLYVEDILRDLDDHVREGEIKRFPDFLKGRLGQADGSIGGILCWDVFDYLEADAAAVLANELTRLLRPDGVMLVLLSTVLPSEKCYTKYVLTEDLTLRPRPYPATRPKRQVLMNRDVNRLFGNLRVAQSFLLRSQLRELLFRKPRYLTQEGDGRRRGV